MCTDVCSRVGVTLCAEDSRPKTHASTHVRGSIRRARALQARGSPGRKCRHCGSSPCPRLARPPTKEQRWLSRPSVRQRADSSTPASRPTVLQDVNACSAGALQVQAASTSTARALQALGPPGSQQQHNSKGSPGPRLSRPPVGTPHGHSRPAARQAANEHTTRALQALAVLLTATTQQGHSTPVALQAASSGKYGFSYPSSSGMVHNLYN